MARPETEIQLAADEIFASLQNMVHDITKGPPVGSASVRTPREQFVDGVDRLTAAIRSNPDGERARE